MESSPTKTTWLRLYMPCHRCGTGVIYRNRTICEQCKEVYYCSVDCCLIHQSLHKIECGKFTTDVSKMSPKAPLPTSWFIKFVQATPCCNCNKKCKEVVRCIKCRGVLYCSLDCMEGHRKKHQSHCAMLAEFLQVQDLLQHGQTFNYLVTKGLTVGREISLSLASLVHEFAAFVVGPFVNQNRPAVTVQIVDPYPHNWRFAVLVRDINMVQTHIIFHDEVRTEASMTGGPNMERCSIGFAPLEMCLKPGNFIILLDAWFHLFKDFTTGVRIDDLEKIHFIWFD